MSKIKLLIVIVIVVCSCSKTKNSIQDHIFGTIGDSAMVVSAHPIASKIGIQILREGGNAVDAAIATQFALAVVYPRAGNIGGGGFSILRLNNGETHALDFREKAPALASKDMYLDDSSEVIPNLSMLGHLAAGVPGSVGGMWELHQKFGSVPWKHLIEPSILIAENGFEITQNEADALNDKQPDFIKANTHSPWVINNSGWKKGDIIKQSDLGRTLNRIRDFGRDGFYKGTVAELIIEEMKTSNGIISKSDLEAYNPVWRDPIKGSYKGHTVISIPPPSSGGVALIQLLQGAEILNITQFPHNSAKSVNLMTELEKRVFADRAKFIGDPDFIDVPINELISTEYVKSRLKNIQADVFTPSSKISGGEMPPQESYETTHFSIVDPMGNAISITTTLNLAYGCKVLVKGAGFLLNNEMDDFSAKPGVPNYFGLVGAEANAIAPNKRMTSSMTPTIIEKNNQLKMVLGSPGGSTIITSVFQSTLNVIDYGMTMQEAVNAKKIHHQWLPDHIKMEENAINSETMNALTTLGHQFEIVSKIGRNDCILIYDDGKIEGGADHTRGDDFAAGF